MASSKDIMIHSTSHRDSLAMGGNSQRWLTETLSLLDSACIGYCLYFCCKTLLLCISTVFNRHISSQKGSIVSQVIKKVFLTLESFLLKEDLFISLLIQVKMYFPVLLRGPHYYVHVFTIGTLWLLI